MSSGRVSPAAIPSQGVQLALSDLLHGREQTMVNVEEWEICLNSGAVADVLLLFLSPGSNCVFLWEVLAASFVSFFS